MSAQSKLEEFIRRLIQQELDEATSTASVGNDSYKTPFAFSDKRKKGKKKKKAGYDGGHKKPTVLGYMLAIDPKLRKTS